MAVIFLIIGLWPLLDAGSPRTWSLGIAGAWAAIALALPRILTGPNRLWMAFGERAGRITNPLVLGLVFFLFVTPMALLMRLFGKDPLGLRLKRSADSYWHVIEGPWDRESMRRQF